MTMVSTTIISTVSLSPQLCIGRHRSETRLHGGPVTLVLKLNPQFKQFMTPIHGSTQTSGTVPIPTPTPIPTPAKRREPVSTAPENLGTKKTLRSENVLDNRRRRALLVSLSLSLSLAPVAIATRIPAALATPLPPPVPTTTPSLPPPTTEEIPPQLAAIFETYLAAIRSNLPPAIASSFTARLAIYNVTTPLPAGIPGDPARDYTADRRNCGEFIPPGGIPARRDAPYAICSADGVGGVGGVGGCEGKKDDRGDSSASSTTTTTKCCRHYAYCVPYDRFPARPIDAVSTVVVSSRVLDLPEANVRGILAHELGHAVDFYLFGRR